MSKQSELEKKKKELAERLDKVISKLESIIKAFAVSRKNSKLIMKKAHERKDDKAAQAIRKKIGLM